MREAIPITPCILDEVISHNLVTDTPVLPIKHQPRAVPPIADQQYLIVRQKNHLGKRVEPVLEVRKIELTIEIRAKDLHKVEPRGVRRLVEHTSISGSSWMSAASG